MNKEKSNNTINNDTETKYYKNHNIICPYCFEEFNYKFVCFQSNVYYNNENEIVDIILKPLGFNSYVQFETNYTGDDTFEIKEKYKDQKRFLIKNDDVLIEWWKKRGGTDKIKNEPRVIISSSADDKKYLSKDINGEYFVYDDNTADGFVKGLRIKNNLNTDNHFITENRLCPKCHNNLPPNYGKFECKFISIVGITGSGKSVYLSRLFNKFDKYCGNIGLSVTCITGPMLIKYLEQNIVMKKKALPQPTPKGVVNPPIIFNVYKGDKYLTLVFYDIAGENCMAGIDTDSIYMPFIHRSDGIIMLLDPDQFHTSINNENVDINKNITNVLNTINNRLIIAGVKSNIPVAACISKADQSYVNKIINEAVIYNNGEPNNNIHNIINLTQVTVVDGNGQHIDRFNAREYNNISKMLSRFMKDKERALDQILSDTFKLYNYFWMSATGCGVKTIGDQSYLDLQDYEAIPDAKRIEEPLYWLFYLWGIINTDISIHNPNKSEDSTKTSKDKLSGENNANDKSGRKSILDLFFRNK